jgi:hypothetical protein
MLGFTVPALTVIEVGTVMLISEMTQHVESLHLIVAIRLLL